MLESAVTRRDAALKAAQTKVRKKRKHAAAAKKASRTKKSPVYKAHWMATASEAALAAWAEDHGWYFLSFTKASGYPRNGIIDGVLIRIAPKAPDVLHVGIVQLKSGGAGLRASELVRLNAAKTKVKAHPMTAFYDGEIVTVEAAHKHVEDAFA